MPESAPQNMTPERGLPPTKNIDVKQSRAERVRNLFRRDNPALAQEKPAQELRVQGHHEDLQKQVLTFPPENKLPILGDFSEFAITNNRLPLPESQFQQIYTQAENHAAERKNDRPSLFTGDKTATEYDSTVGNFSTRTAILKTPNGERVFAVYNPPSSWFHRALDGASKRLSGDRMTKASSKEWKERFEGKSNIPTIPNPNPNMILMPYIPNVNAYDALAENKNIENFGECSWAKTLSPEDKVALGTSIIQELGEVHSSGKAWGEVILPNVIFTKDKAPVIVDPEVSYDNKVPLTEQQARDLFDIVRSVSGALHKSEGFTDTQYESVVKSLLDAYPSQEVIQTLKELAAKKPSITARIYAPFYEPARLGISMKEASKVNQAILSYQHLPK